MPTRETYNYTIRTGSYPQIIHEPSFNATGGIITCTSFEDANGKVHTDWIPAIRLWKEKKVSLLKLSFQRKVAGYRR